MPSSCRQNTPDCGRGPRRALALARCLGCGAILCSSSSRRQDSRRETDEDGPPTAAAGQNAEAQQWWHGGRTDGRAGGRTSAALSGIIRRAIEQPAAVSSQPPAATQGTERTQRTTGPGKEREANNSISGKWQVVTTRSEGRREGGREASDRRKGEAGRGARQNHQHDEIPLSRSFLRKSNT